MKTWWYVLLAVAVAHFNLCPCSAQSNSGSGAKPGPSIETMRKAMRSVAEVDASDCVGGANHGTGFLFGASNTVVTALHVVAGCKAFSIFFEAEPGAKPQPARVVRVLQSRDLVLLELDNSSAKTDPLRIRSRDIDLDEALAGIGYSPTEPSLGNKLVFFSSGVDRLPKIVGQREQYGLSDAGIDLQARVLRFSSPLNPGMSGGPIIDADGLVVGIVAGGQTNIPAPASWGWPAEYMIDLQKSQEPTDVSSRRRPDFLFSIPGSTTIERRRCGALEFILDRRLILSEAIKSPDDENYMRSFLAQLEAYPDAKSQAYDIWREVEGGAAVLVPSTADLKEAGDHCLASLNDIKEVVWGQRLIMKEPLALENMLTRFGRTFGNGVYGAPIGNPLPPIPSSRADGTQFLREGALLGQNIEGHPLTKAVVNRKAMRRGDSIVIVQMANEVPGLMLPNMMAVPGPTFAQQCQSMSGIDCDRFAADFRAVPAFLLAIELSTYPPH